VRSLREFDRWENQTKDPYADVDAADCDPLTGICSIAFVWDWTEIGDYCAPGGHPDGTFGSYEAYRVSVDWYDPLAGEATEPDYYSRCACDITWTFRDELGALDTDGPYEISQFEEARELSQWDPQRW
jgi:hypothetical protein